MRTILFLLLVFFWMTGAQAEYKVGAKHHVMNDALDFDAVELQIDGKFVGFIYENSPPMVFSKNFYVYATCPVDQSTGEPNGYCINWEMYDINKKMRMPLSLPGLTFFSIPSFSWPYIAYVKTPEQITKENFKNGFVGVSCVVVEWPTKNLIAERKLKVNVGHFESDVPSFQASKFIRSGTLLKVTCAEYENPNTPGAPIATLTIPRATNK